LVGPVVPDLRGLFLRGLGSRSFNSGGFGNIVHSSSPLGQIQGDAIRNIAGSFSGMTVNGYVARAILKTIPGIYFHDFVLFLPTK
jgi:hypothetical protein